MFLDYLYTLPNATDGIDNIAIQTFNLFPGFGAMLLFFIFMLVFIGGISRQTLRTGAADYSAWAIIASLSTLVPALLLSVSSGFIQLDWLIIIVSINILSAIWFFLDRKASEL